MHIASNRALKGFDYVTLNINDLTVHATPDSKTGRMKVDHIILQDEKTIPTQRFWTSLFSRYGINNSLFKYYNYDEVFTRISEREANDRIRVCVERPLDPNQPINLVGVSNPDKVLISYDELVDMLSRNRAEGVRYNEGIIQSMHTPRIGASGFEIGPDKFEHRFAMATPIDGYGGPNVYLALKREACQNMVICFSALFKSSLSLGKGQDDVFPTMLRAIDQFNTEEGYATVRDRIASSQQSWASVYETEKLYKLCLGLYSKKLFEDGAISKQAVMLRRLVDLTETNQPVDGIEQAQGLPILRAFHAMTGDTQRIYGLANLDSLSDKRQRTLPTKATVYDVVNFATELSTHYALPGGSNMMDQLVGNMLSEEFDMEGTRTDYSDFTDFMIERKGSASLGDE